MTAHLSIRWSCLNICNARQARGNWPRQAIGPLHGGRRKLIPRWPLPQPFATFRGTASGHGPRCKLVHHCNNPFTMPRPELPHKRVRATAPPTHPPSIRARSCSTNVCGQLLRQRVWATAPLMCAGNCSANVCGQLLHQRVRATPPLTCASNCSTNVRATALLRLNAFAVSG